MPGDMLGLSPYLNLWQIIVGDFFGGGRYTQAISSNIFCTSKAYRSDKNGNSENVRDNRYTCR